MDSFKRIFKYIWPQWPRLIFVAITAIIVAALLSLSFMTVIPLLKVMIEGEGLHSWVDRKIASHRYGVKFYMPEKMDFVDSNIGFHLLVTNIEEDGLAQKADLRNLDKIVGANEFKAGEDGEKVSSDKLFEVLSTAESNVQIDLQVYRLNRNGVLEIETIKLVVGEKAFYIEYLENLMDFLPRDQSSQNRTKGVVFIIVVMGCVTIIRCIAKFYQTYLAQKVVLIGLNLLREDVYGHVMNLPIKFFAAAGPSDTVSRIVNDTAVMGKAIKIMLGKALREPLNAIFMMGFAMWLNWQLTLIFLCGAPATLWLAALFGKKMKKATKKSLVASAQMLTKLQETMVGLKVVKVYNQQDHELELFGKINNRLLKQLLKISRVDAITTPVMEVLGMIAGSAALIVGAYWVSARKMESSEFLVMLLLMGSAAEAIRKTSGIWNKIQEANAASERVFAIIDEPAETEKPVTVELSPLKNEVEFRNIVFTYPGAENPVLKGVNLTVKAGHNVAIVGPNGSGKTTLVNLIPRFYDIDSGEILLDGQDIAKANLSTLRDQIGMVTQNVVTFNDTVAANIAYGKTGASREEIIDAAKRSFAHEFISLMPNGYETVIGEQGAGLSGGQLQRLVIARAILKNPAILIFDEATSQVDADSEAKIHKAIEEIMRDRTSFVIAHRFSTIINSDVIVVMDNGEIIAQGQHAELIKSCKLYQNLYETQLTSS